MRFPLFLACLFALLLPGFAVQAKCVPVEATPRPDVAYRPDVDVHGRKLVPADIGGSGAVQGPPPVVLNLPPEQYVREGRGNVAPGQAFIPMGTVTTDANGHALLNDQPLDDGGTGCK